MSTFLITGATGFLGSCFMAYLSRGGVCISLGRGAGNHISCDLASEIPRIPEVDIVIHCAGMAHQRITIKKEKDDFFLVNVQGTKNLLSALSQECKLPKSLVMISSVAVYGRESGIDLDENTPLLASTPYAKSKVEAEVVVNDWCRTNGVNGVILRLPLVVGGGRPKGNLASIIAGIRRGYYFRPGSGSARRSMVLAEDVARLIPRLSGVSGVFNLTDGLHPSIAELDSAFGAVFKRRINPIPIGLLSTFAKLGDFLPGSSFNTEKFLKMTSSLTFDDGKAKSELGWSPRSVIEQIPHIFGQE